MPQVAKMIEEDYHVTPMLQDPDEAVAKGAAIFAANEKAFKDFVLSEAQKVGKTVEELTEENLADGGKLEEKFAKLSAGASGRGVNWRFRNVLSRSYGVIAIDDDDKEAVFNLLKCNMSLPAKGDEDLRHLCGCSGMCRTCRSANPEAWRTAILPRGTSLWRRARLDLSGQRAKRYPR